jgi:hypothetical protein
MSSTTAVVDAVTTVRLRDRLRANRGLLVIGVVVLVGAVLLAVAQSNRQRGFLDPQAVDPTGSAALATILEEQGVRVVRTTDAATAADELRAAEGTAALLVAPTAVVSERMARTVGQVPRAGAVLVVPDEALLAEFAPWASPDSFRTDDTEIEPGCDWPVATRTGSLPVSGTTYASTRAEIVSCWGGAVLDLSGQGDTTRFTTVIGDPAPLTNDRLDESGNAALALNTLGRSSTLVWWLPSATDPLQFAEDTPVQLGDLIPSWVSWALLQLVVAVLLTIWWRGRRLGRVVMEPLPVVVRATETVEGRARLYRRSSARGRAADALRGATTGRLRARLSLPRGVPLTDVVVAVAARTGRPETEVAALLTPGGDPIDDAGLTRLAQTLDNLENEVRRT